MAGGTEVAAFTREGHKILMAAVFAPDSGETIVEDAAIKITIDDLLNISTQEAVLGREPLVIDLLEFLKVILNASVMQGILWFPRTVCGRNVRDEPKAFWIVAEIDFPGCAYPGILCREWSG